MESLKGKGETSMELSVKERLVLAVILPKQGDIITYRFIQSLKITIGFSEQELVKWMPTICYDLSKGCPRCGETKWEQIAPFTPVQKCLGCGFRSGVGVPGSQVWRTLDEKGNAIGETAEVEFGEAGFELIANTLNLFNKNKELNEDTVPLYEKFVEGKE